MNTYFIIKKSGNTIMCCLLIKYMYIFYVNARPPSKKASDHRPLAFLSGVMDLCLQGVGQTFEAGATLGIERGAYGDDGLHDVYALHLPHALAYQARGGRGP